MSIPRSNQYTRWLLPIGLTAFLTLAAGAAEDNTGVKITDHGQKATVEINGQLFTEYVYQETPRPYLYPVIGPGGAAMTRNWPMKEAPDEARDHPHHKSLWFTHGAVNGVDFWADGAKNGKIVQDKFTALQSGEKEGLIRAHNKWITAQDKVVCTEDRVLRFAPVSPDGFLIDWVITIHASQGEVKFGDTKEGSMAIRIAESMRLTSPKKGQAGKGHIINSAGQRDGTTWSKRAEWCDYYGPVGDQIVGVAIFDHPKNPRFPTWWHVRDYGLFAANPFGIHDFEKKPAGAGDLVIPAGESITFRYRFYFHKGDHEEGKVALMYTNFLTEKPLE